MEEDERQDNDAGGQGQAERQDNVNQFIQDLMQVPVDEEFQNWVLDLVGNPLF